LEHGFSADDRAAIATYIKSLQLVDGSKPSKKREQ
jgi:hypothetical protein